MRRKCERVRNERLPDDPFLFSDKARQIAPTSWFFFLPRIRASLLNSKDLPFSLFMYCPVSLDLTDSLWEPNRSHNIYIYSFFFLFFIVVFFPFTFSFFFSFFFTFSFFVSFHFLCVFFFLYMFFISFFLFLFFFLLLFLEGS